MKFSNNRNFDALGEWELLRRMRGPLQHALLRCGHLASIHATHLKFRRTIMVAVVVQVGGLGVGIFALFLSLVAAFSVQLLHSPV
ncbi:hypothetical protein ABKN59_007674 [Abortiporus biennis]